MVGQARAMAITVVIVDDDHSFTEIAGDLLRARGFNVVGEATTEEEAVTGVQRLRPDAVLLDVRLGEADGFDVVGRLSIQGTGPAVLLTSSDPNAATGELARRSGAVGFVAKEDLARADLVGFFRG